MVKYTLVPARRRSAGSTRCPSTITENAIRTVIHHYTKESGVRSLEREIASVCRKVARQVVNANKETPGKVDPIEVAAKTVPKYLGVPKFRLGKKEEQDGLRSG